MNNPLPWRVALTSYVAGLAVVGFWPMPVDKPISRTLAAVFKYLHNHGAPEWFDYHFVEASANVMLFVPLGIAMAMALPAVPWWQLSGIGLTASTSLELGQLILIPARFSSPMDIVTNTFGAVIGVAVARLMSARSDRVT